MIMKDIGVESNGEMMSDLNEISVYCPWNIIFNFVLNRSWRAWSREMIYRTLMK